MHEAAIGGRTHPDAPFFVVRNEDDIGTILKALRDLPFTDVSWDADKYGNPLAKIKDSAKGSKRRVMTICVRQSSLKDRVYGMIEGLRQAQKGAV